MKTLLHFMEKIQSTPSHQPFLVFFTDLSRHIKYSISYLKSIICLFILQQANLNIEEEAKLKTLVSEYKWVDTYIEKALYALCCAVQVTYM